MRLTDINTVKEIMREFDLNFKKKFGQNFLINASVPARIADECTNGDFDCGILEIGPGIGTLTYELAKRYKKVVAVEIDTTLLPALEHTLAEFDNVTVISADIMKTDVKELCKREFSDIGMHFSVCANLPYYITTPVIMHLLESGAGFDYVTVMIQKEVVARLCSMPGTADYGAITASVSYYGEVKKLFSVPAGCFMPAPKVDSAVMRIRLHEEPPVKTLDTGVFFRVIRGAFAQRRKTLPNSLSSEFGELDRACLTGIVEESGFSATVRGEALGIEDFARIADMIVKAKFGETATYKP
ncbi:MAG: 16S rRNA (adenine(1518)-N(6)/adenine(1519)-N(6))-dimethyltransferase RsmA [Clostridia bacterium]|nr:16S rRNA (adenine(1518)-N(6)/adenine(1519)-N(6))-dimethyltransferase RsmA [Clostridia bacterium]